MTRSLFETTAVLPVQFLHRPPATAEERLMLAVLEDAVACCQRYAFGRRARACRLFVDAYAWIHCRDRDWPFSFENICETLRVDPSYVRAGLDHWLQRRRDSLQDIETELSQPIPLRRRSLGSALWPGVEPFRLPGLPPRIPGAGFSSPRLSTVRARRTDSAVPDRGGVPAAG